MINKNPINTLFLFICMAFTNTIQASGNNSPGTINALAINPSDPGSMLAATNEGVWTFKQGNWREFTSPQSEITDLANTLSNRQVIYMVSRDGTLYKTNDQGKNYNPIEVRINGINYSVRTVTTHHINSDELMVGSNDGYVIHSKDGGKSWQLVNEDFPFTAINSVAIDPKNSKTLYVGTGGNGILKSTDSGKNWNRMNEGLNDLTITRIVADPNNNSILYAGTYGGGVYKTNNQGKSWVEVNQGLTDNFVYSLAVSPSKFSKHSEIYVGVFGGDLYRSSTDGDINWEKL